MNKLYLRLLLVLFLITPETGRAAATSLFDLSLKELLATEVVTTASKYQQDWSSASAVSSTVTRTEIEAFGANNLVEVLERVVSIHMTGSNFFPQNVTAMRGDLLGHYDNHILLLLNGRPLRESYSGGVNFSIYIAFPLSVIERIEIIRGPGSVLYGTNAYSGVVNIISQTTQQNRISVELGSFDSQAIEFSGHLSDQTSGNDWKINWGIKAFEEEGWNFVAIDNNNVAGQTDYGEENLSVFVNGKVEEFSGEILYTRSHQGFIGASVAWPSDPLDNQRTMDSDRLFVNLAHQTQLSDHWQLNSHLSYSSMTFDHYNYQGYSNDKQLELTALYQPNKQFNGVLGGTLWRQEVGSKERLRPAPVPEFQATWYNFYGQVAYDISDHLNVSSGLQWNKAEDLSPKTVFRMGLNYQMSDTSGVKVMHAQAYRAAFGVETGFLLILTNPDGTIRGGLRGNPQLDAEEISTTDVQWFYHTDNLQFVLTAYQSKLKKLITRERAPDNVIDFVNKGELTIKGFEFESKYNMNKIWHFMASYSYQWNQTGDKLTNYTTVPNHMLKAGIIYQPEQGVNLGIFRNYVSEATDIAIQNPNRQPYNPDAEAYSLWTIKFSVNLGKFHRQFENMKLSLYGYNVGDEGIYQPDFIGKIVNTLPARQGVGWYLKLNYHY